MTKSDAESALRWALSHVDLGKLRAAWHPRPPVCEDGYLARLIFCSAGIAGGVVGEVYRIIYR